MATIENLGATTVPAFREELRKMDNGTLFAQQVIQQGAVHAISHLLRIGASEKNALDTLAALRLNMQLVREEARRRGVTDLFPEDQTGFN